MPPPWPVATSAHAPAVVGCTLWRAGGVQRLTVFVGATFGFVHGGVARRVAALPFTRDDEAPELPGVGVRLSGHARAPGGLPVGAVVTRLALLAGGAGGALLDRTVHVRGDRQHGGAEPLPFVRMPLAWERAFGGPEVSENPAGATWPNLLDPADPRHPACFAAVPRAFPARDAAVQALDAQAPGPPDLPEGVDPHAFHAAPPEQQLASLAGDEWIVLDGMHASLPRLVTRLPGAHAVARWMPASGAPASVELCLDTLAIEADDLVVSLVWRGSFALAGSRPRGRIEGAIVMPDMPPPWPIAPRAPVAPPLAQTHGSAPAPTPPAVPPAPLSTPAAPAPAAPPRATPLPSTPAVLAAVERDSTMAIDIESVIARPLAPFALTGPSSDTTARAPRLTATPWEQAPVPGAHDEPRTEALDIEALLQPLAPFAVAEPRGSRPALAPPLPGTPWGPAAPPVPALVAGTEARTVSGLLEVPPSSIADATPPPRASQSHEPALPDAVAASAEPAAEPVKLPRRADSSPFDATGGVDMRSLFDKPIAPFAVAEPSANAPAPVGPLPGAPWSVATSARVAIEDALSTLDMSARQAIQDARGPGAPKPLAPPPPLPGALEGVLAAADAADPVRQTALASTDLLRERVIAALVAREPLRGLDLRDADLRGVDLRGAALAEARLAGANLSGCSLVGANLAEADLTGAFLVGSDLSGADLTRTDLTRASGKDAKLVGVLGSRTRFARGRWEGAVFDRAELTSPDFTGAKLEGARFDGAGLVDLCLDDAQADRASFVGARLPGLHAEGASFVGASFAGADAPEAMLERANLDDASFAGANLERANLERASVARADFTGGRLARVVLGRATGEGARFDGASLEDADLRGAKLTAASLVEADLRAVVAVRADLSRAKLDRANLVDANLRSGKLPDASFVGAKLDGADLRDADLERCDFTGASREGTKLKGANLKDAKGARDT